MQLRTRTKMFCACRTTFGDPPNTNVCPVCLGLPGALPGAERRSRPPCRVGGARAGLHRARDQRLRPKELLLSRPAEGLSDLPVRPAARDRRTGRRSTRPSGAGSRSASPACTSRRTPGKLLHDRFPGKTAVDLNRAGIPLAEIVSEPDLRSPAEARAYLTTLRQILVYAGVSECSMEQGSLRVDANISIRRPGETSPRHQDRGEEHELVRQRRARAGGRAGAPDGPARSAASGCEQVTLLFNAATGQVKPTPVEGGESRLPVFPRSRSPAARADARPGSRSSGAALPELPEARRTRLERRSGSRPTTRG